MEILSWPWEEEKLLSMGYNIEQLLQIKKAPILAREVIEVPNYQDMPVIVPDRENIPSVYPLGTL